MKIKKLLCMGMAVFLVCSNLLQINVYAFEKNVEGNIRKASETENTEEIKVTEDGYQYTDSVYGGWKIIGYTGSNMELVVPENIEGKEVSCIGEYTFSDCKTLLKSISIPDSVTKIERGTFSECSNLKRIELPERLQFIEHYIFRGCSSLETISIPENVIEIEDYAFEGCSSLTEIMIPNSVKEIGKDAFMFCAGLKSVSLPEGIESISEYTFAYCDSLEYVNIPQSVTAIGYGAFKNCSSLICIDLPQNVSELEGYVFAGCGSLKTINVSEENISFVSVDGCLYSKDKTEFLVCPGAQTKVSIPASVILIKPYAFKGENSLESIEVSEVNNNYASVDGCLYSKDKTEFLVCPGMKTKVNIPNSVTQIDSYAFEDCRNLEDIVLPESVLEIGNDAFANCSSLKVINIPANIKMIERSVFEGCRSLVDVYIPEGIQSISAQAFGGCVSLLSIRIPKSIIFIFNTSFIDCNKDLRLVVYKDSYAETFAKENGFKYSYIEPGGNPACNHTYSDSIAKAATGRNGSITKTCSQCGKKITTTIYAPKTIKLSKINVTYNNKAHKPSVIIKDSKGKSLSNKKDFTVIYPKNIKNVGKYTVTIKFKGNYRGTVKKNFTIAPKGTSISKVIPKGKGVAVKWKKQTEQTSGYEIACSTDKRFSKKNTRIVLVGKNNITSKTVAKLKGKKKYYVRVRTYKTVKGKKYYSGWSKVKHAITRK